MAVYKCMVCGNIYDEEKEGKPVSEAMSGCVFVFGFADAFGSRDAADRHCSPSGFTGTGPVSAGSRDPVWQAVQDIQVSDNG